jgi:hypothetical protein
VAADPRVDGVFEYRGGAGEEDFRLVDLPFEVTTSYFSTVKDHLRRPYVDLERLATYEPLPKPLPRLLPEP